MSSIDVHQANARRPAATTSTRAMFGGLFGGDKTTTKDPGSEKADVLMSSAANCKIATGE